jgi:transglutaminase-like putative cysteine protease
VIRNYKLWLLLLGLGAILTLVACTLGGTPLPPVRPPVVVETVEYGVEQTVTLVNGRPGTTTNIRLRVALLRDIEPYQVVTSTEITPYAFETITDDYGNEYAEFEFTDVAPGGKVAVKLRYEVRVNELDFDLGNCEGPLPDIFVDPEQNIESDVKQIRDLAKELAEGNPTACEMIRAFYDYVGDNVSFAGYDRGDNGALATLENRAGDCTDFADLLIALSRAAGIPARFIEGVTCCTNGYTDEEYDEGATKHDWLEVYLPGSGWVPMDPTLGRKRSEREIYFAGMTPDHIVVSQGRNLSALEDSGEYGHYWRRWPKSARVEARERWRVVRLSE